MGKVQEKLDTKRGSQKDKKGKDIICHALGLCLKAAWQWREQMLKEMNNLREEIEERKLVELSLQCQNDQLKKQLRESKQKTKNLEG